MLTAFNIHSSKVFQYLVNKFAPKDGIVLDLTYGRGLSWQGFENKKNLNIIKVDKRKTENDVIQMDLCLYLEKVKDESFDVIYFDPPHYFCDKVSKLNVEGRDLNNIEEVYCSEKEFLRMLDCVSKHVKRVLKNNGVLIVKMIDGYVGKTYYPNTFLAFNKLVKSGLIPFGHFISVMSRKSFGKDIVQVNHISFLVFRKVEK